MKLSKHGLYLQHVSDWKIIFSIFFLNPLSANPTKWSNTLKQFVGNLSANCLSVFDHFVGLGLKGLTVRFFLLHFQGSIVNMEIQGYVSTNSSLYIFNTFTASYKRTRRTRSYLINQLWVYSYFLWSGLTLNWI